MIVDFILSIPYYMVILFVRRRKWDGWLSDLQWKERKADRESESIRTYDEQREWDKTNRPWRTSLKWRLVRRRWPLSL